MAESKVSRSVYHTLAKVRVFFCPTLSKRDFVNFLLGFVKKKRENRFIFRIFVVELKSTISQF